jgi:large subunit ribosomal protein L3
MKRGLVGKKLGMTHIFTPEGVSVPVSVIEAGPCTVTQVKTVKKEGYSAIQIGFEDVKESRATKPLRGHFAKSGSKAKRFLREIRMDDVSGFEPGQEIGASLFKEGESVDVVGVSKGKGFAGVMKRWGFSGAPASHGTHGAHRRPGSISSHSSNLGTGGQIKKGKKMPGHMGSERVTVQNLLLVRVDGEKNLLFVRGGVPGPDGGYLVIREAVKAHG